MLRMIVKNGVNRISSIELRTTRPFNSLKAREKSAAPRMIIITTTKSNNNRHKLNGASQNFYVLAKNERRSCWRTTSIELRQEHINPIGQLE